MPIRVPSPSSGVARRKQTPDHTWLADVPATCLTQCLRDQDRAFANFFAHRARYPRFKRKCAGGSLRFQGVGTAWPRGILSLPKLGKLKLAEELPGIEKPDMVTLLRDATGRYFVSFSSEIDSSSFSLPIVNRSVGVDLVALLAYPGLDLGYPKALALPALTALLPSGQAARRGSAKRAS